MALNATAINWTDWTWNPVTGCTAVSAGCKHCYAEDLAERRRGSPAFPVGFDVMLRPWKLRDPAKVARPSLVFVNSMSDLFHEVVPDSYREQVLAAMAAAPQHRYQVLTKRPEIAARYFATRPVPSSMWLGVTVEHTLTIGRVDVLRSIDARIRFISVEPLLEPLNLRRRLDGVHWVIVGGESGAHLMAPDVAERRALVVRATGGLGRRWSPRPERAPWLRELRDACAAAGVAFWFKQWGGPRPESGGRELDGRTHSELPEEVTR